MLHEMFVSVLGLIHKYIPYLEIGAKQLENVHLTVSSSFILFSVPQKNRVATLVPWNGY